MTQPYTARQLDFFTATLKILDAAVFKTGMPLDVTGLQEIALTSKIEARYTAPITDVDTPEPTPAFNRQPEAITVALPSIKTGKAFFQSLPWQEQQPAVIATTHADDVLSKFETVRHEPTSAAVTAQKNLQTGAAFFQSLPWNRSSTVASTIEAVTSNLAKPASTHEADTASSEKANLSQTAQTSSAFFKSLPWHSEAISTTQSIAAEKNSVNLPVADSSALAQAVEKTCTRFFTDLPWQGTRQAIEATDFIAAMNNEDAAAIANLATLTALQAAQRGASKQRSPAQQNAGGFFQTLPW